MAEASYKVVGDRGETNKPYELSRCCCREDEVWLVVPVANHKHLDLDVVAVAICPSREDAEFVCKAMNQRGGRIHG